MKKAKRPSGDGNRIDSGGTSFAAVAVGDGSAAGPMASGFAPLCAEATQAVSKSVATTSKRHANVVGARGFSRQAAKPPSLMFQAVRARGDVYFFPMSVSELLSHAAVPSVVALLVL